MFKNVYEYLEELKRELEGCDPALIQDALSDAERHLRMALEEALSSQSSLSETEAIAPIIEKYGNPKEIASAYRTIESRTSPSLAVSRRKETRSSWARFFSVLAEPKAWGAFFYMLLSFVTGIVFGGWALFAGIISVCTLVFIIGIPIIGLFLLSIRGIALLEGRIVEELLGLRMPRRPLFVQKGLSWYEKFKALITESHTWKALAYMILHFPIGLVYFFGTATMVALSLKCFLYPLWYWGFGRPLINLNQPIYPPVWSIPLITMAGIIMFLLILHLAKSAGKIHGRFAKFMLVRKLQEINHV